MIDLNTLTAQRQRIMEIADRYGARDVRIFGSVARGQEQKHSDLDLLVRFDPGRSLFDHGGLIAELQEALGVDVDVVSQAGMRQRFRDRVLKEAIPL